jgi:hypothetical protein
MKKYFLSLVIGIIAAFGFGGVADAHTGTCSVSIAAVQPTYLPGALQWRHPWLGGATQASVTCTNSGLGTDVVSGVNWVSQLFIGGTSSYDNGFGWQLSVPGDYQTSWSLNGESILENSYGHYGAANMTFDTHGRNLCDGVPHWYGIRYYAQVGFKDGSLTGAIVSPDSPGVYRSC